ncbi:MAG TPA: hypothetical protein VHM70_00150 [Polyangiaceae bacterium]|nr:hypothetical protein [Polyangiaceae bacterium]
MGLLGATACATDAPLEPLSQPRAQTPAPAPQSEISQSAPGNADLNAAQREPSSPSIPEPAKPDLVMDPSAERRVEPATAAALERSLEQRLSHSMDGLDKRQAPGGGELVDTRGRFQHVVVQVRDANGQMHTECVETHEQLHRALTKGAGQ